MFYYLLTDDYILPPNQPRNDGTPLKQTTQTNSELGFLTPINHLTALENMNSDSKVNFSIFISVLI